MRFKQVIVILLCFLLVGCGEEHADKIETKTDRHQENKEIEEVLKDDVTSLSQINSSSEEDIQTEDGISDEGVNNTTKQEETSADRLKIQEKSKTEIMTNWDKALMEKSKELGFVDVEDSVEEKLSHALEKDTLSYDGRLKGLELFQSVVHKGFDQLKIIYETQTYNWTEFFGEYNYSLQEEERIVYLKGKNIHEAVLTNPMAKQYRYYREDHGMHYEVSELVMDSMDEASDQDATERNVKKFGMCSYFDVFLDINPPSHNPFLLEKDMFVVDCRISTIEDEPVIYIEKSMRVENGHKLIKEWVSIKDGIVIKRESYNEKGVIEKLEVAKAVSYEAIEDQIFFEPTDVDYKDLTFFIYLYDEENKKEFQEAFRNTFIDEPFSMALINLDTKEKLKLYSTSGEMKQVLIESTASNAAGKSMKAFYFRDVNADYFTTIIPELKLIEHYRSSVVDMKWFAFEALGFRGRRVDDGKAVFTFQDLGMGGVHDYYTFYDYSIDLKSGKFVQIDSYLKESLKGKEVPGYRKRYVLSELKKESIDIFDQLGGYKEIKHETHYDGEHPPSWWD
ncbi:hypothetical protein [Petrocella sp. FN5]|uniref:hypothetical protein n=1 Tax=Petrocella sp. FN5 TaxID=3032002 RepID=UPI0023DCBB6B|nr:hypothetical protein [Petrocella sp. FN5]MDF1616870.1 hypothetical protein [Petrocella sp. FN5]